MLRFIDLLTGESYMTYPSKGSGTTLYCGAGSFIGSYMLWFDDLLTGESYTIYDLYRIGFAAELYRVSC